MMFEGWKVVSEKNLPTRFPIINTAVFYLLLDRFDASGWAWGVVFTILAIAWIISIIRFIKQEQVELFKDDGGGE